MCWMNWKVESADALAARLTVLACARNTAPRVEALITATSSGPEDTPSVISKLTR